ncbi:MAG: virulence RhuM family protein [Saprospiraceae bacterium]|nr:virulence RhuM family protein [Saprospiraceae bacterium]
MTELIIYSTDDGKAAVTLLARDGDVWMNQEQLATLFATSKQNVSLHILNILKEKEIEKDSVVKDYLTTASDGKSYTTKFYALEMILAIGFRVRSPRGTQFRKWANEHLREFMIKGFVMDDQRLKNPDGRPSNRSGSRKQYRRSTPYTHHTRIGSTSLVHPPYIGSTLTVH